MDPRDKPEGDDTIGAESLLFHDRRTSRAYTSRDWSSAAFTKLANNGCGAKGLDFSSG